MKIEHVEIWGLDRSKKSAGFPHGKYDVPKKIQALGQAKAGSGHDCFLKGVVVAHVVTASQAWWLQWQRYHFQDIVSSTSKMHSILGMEHTFHPATDKEVIKLFKKLVKSCVDIVEHAPELRKEITESLAMSCPMGLELTAEVRTNYLQLKTIYLQRKNHKLSEWREYCDWIKSLDGFYDLTQ